jgi:hypothetical protein
MENNRKNADTRKGAMIENEAHLRIKQLGENSDLEFYWIQIEHTSNILIYPTNCVELLKDLNNNVKHFIYKENG